MLFMSGVEINAIKWSQYHGTHAGSAEMSPNECTAQLGDECVSWAVDHIGGRIVRPVSRRYLCMSYGVLYGSAQKEHCIDQVVYGAPKSYRIPLR